MKFRSRPFECYFMALSSSRLRTLFAHSIMSSSVITSSSRLDWTIFLLTIRPTSVLLSRKGRSRSSYRSKSVSSFPGYRNRVNSDTGKIFRTGGVLVFLDFRMLPQVFALCSSGSSNLFDYMWNSVVWRSRSSFAGLEVNVTCFWKGSRREISEPDINFSVRPRTGRLSRDCCRPKLEASVLPPIDSHTMPPIFLRSGDTYDAKRLLSPAL